VYLYIIRNEITGLYYYDNIVPFSPLRCAPWLLIQLSSIPDGLWLLPACFCFIPIIFKPSCTSSVRPLRGLSRYFISSIVAAANCFGILWFCTLSSLPHGLSRRNFIHFRMYSPCNMSFISLLVLILQCPPLTVSHTRTKSSFKVSRSRPFASSSLSEFPIQKSVWVVLEFCVVEIWYFGTWLGIRILTCDSCAWFACHDFGINVHFLYQLFATDATYVKLSASSNLKSRVVIFEISSG
jgi:hypothetical protein